MALQGEGEIVLTGEGLSGINELGAEALTALGSVDAKVVKADGLLCFAEHHCGLGAFG